MSSPIIFEKGTRDFSTLGLGLLSDAIQATTTEELNGQFIFEMDYPVSGNNADLIKENRIIVVNSGHILKRQGFIIRQIVRKIDLTMTVYAEHVSYATLDVALAPVGTISGDAKTALENWKRMLVPAVDFTVDSDILTTNSTLIGAPEFETARQGLGGHAGSILDVWGGEYQFDNWHIRLLKQRGKSANAIIAYGRNLISFEQDTNIADTYTSVYPYYQENSGDDGNKTHFLPERTVDSEFVGKYPNPKVLMLDLSNKFKDVADYSETKLRNYALSYIQSNNIGVPKVNMKISTVDLSRATGGFSEDIDLGDTVNVYFEKLGITTSAKVIKAVWNVLSDDYDKFEIGARRASLTESISELATTADENANKALNQALVALQSADGKSTIYYLNSSDPWPTNPNENDTAFVKDGENGIMYRYMFNNDTGMFSWVKILDSMSADQIKQRVSDALESGKAYSDQLVADNVAQVNAVLDDVQAKQADLTAQQAELDTKAQGYANKALDDAKADTLATATQTAKDAQDALDSAKTTLTTSLNKEVTDRTNAVSALDTKAQGYADTAKADAIATANGAVAKEVTDRQKAITDLDAKSTGAINQAKTDAQSALDALQVGGRNYVLNSNISITGSNATKNPLMSSVSTSDFSNKPLVLSVQVDYDNITALDSSTLKRLGFEVEMVETNGKHRWKSIWVYPKIGESFHGRVYMANQNNGEQYIDTRSLVEGLYIQGVTGTDVKLSKPKLEIGNKATDYTQAPEDIVLDYTTKDNVISQSLTRYQATNDGNVSKAQSDATQALGLVATKVSQTDYNTKTGDLDSKYTAVKQTADQASTDIVAIKSTNTSQDTKINALTSDVSGTKQSISDIQTEQDTQSTKINTIQTDVSGTKQDIIDIQTKDGEQDTRMGTIETSVDGVSANFTSYKSTNDGKVTTAQSTATQALNGLTTKVSQTDYNTKTGDLTTKVNTAQSTADSVTTSLNTYKSSNDGKVNKAQADIVVNTNAIATKVAQTTYDTKTNQLQTDLNTTTTTANTAKTDIVAIKSDNTKQDARMLQIESDANGTKTTVSNLQMDLGTANGSITTLQQRADGFDATVTKVNGLSVGGRNYVLNSKKSTTSYSDAFKSSMPTSGFSNKLLVVSTQVDYDNITALPTGSGKNRIGVEFIFPKIGGGAVYLNAWNFPTIGGSFHGRIYQAIDATKITFADTINNGIGGIYVQNITGTNVVVSNPKLEIGTFATDYTQAPEDVDNKISTVSQTVDGISSIVSDPTTGLTKRVQTAEGSISTVQSNVSDLQSKQTQTANGLTTEISNRATGDTNTLTQAKDFTTSSITSSEKGMSSQITQTSDAILGKVGAVNLFPNSEFEKDYGYAVLNGNTTLSLGVKNTVDGHLNGTVNVVSTTTAYQGYWARNIPVYGGHNYSASVLVHYVNNNVTGGNAYLDIWYVDQDGNRISRGDNVTGSSGVAEQGSNAWWVKLTYEGIAPINAVYLQVNLLVNDAGAGQTAMFTQPMVTATEKLQAYTPNNDITTQLALLKDNWSIGIADNAGAITSGIVGNASNMSLISNNVTINSPQTQIKGTAWINSAMIGNGQIGNAQIGDASITSAKIASLDVAKLTGNVSSFIQSNWNGVFASTMIDNTGMSINGGNTTTKFDTTGAHYSNSSGINATYSFGKWSDSNSNATSATGLYIGATGSSNAFINILSTNGAAALVLAGTAMDFGSNLNVLQGALNAYVNVNIRERLMFKANRYVGGQPSYIEVNEINRTFNFFTGGGSGTNKDYFYFNQNVISAGTFSSTSVLSKKNVKSVYDEDALGEIAKTQLVNFEYKNRIGQNHVSPIIDDVNSEKEYYIPKTILGQDNEYVDMYSMISMAWRAIQQLNEKIGEK